MSWGSPWVLLALVFPVLGFILLRRMARRDSLLRWPALRRVEISGNEVRSASAPKMRTTVFAMLAIAFALIAIAQPRWGEGSSESYSHTREVMIAVDLSRSMLAEDVAPSRLDHARQLTEYLLDSLQGESVGLVVFAGSAFVQVPLSPDYRIIREFLPSLDTDYLPRGGSDYSKMLDAALEGFSETADRDRYLVVLSDGESSTEGWEQRLGRLAEREIHVVAIGLGTANGAFVPDLQNGGYLADSNGDAVHSKLMPATLEALARRTQGKYFDGGSLRDVADVKALLAQTVETGRKGRVSNAAGSAGIERFQWFLLPAILFGLLSLLREFQQRTKPRQVRKEDAGGSSEASDVPARLAACIVLAAALSLPPPARAHFDSEAEFQVQEVFDSNPAERLRAIADHLARYGYDAFDLRLMVEASIRYGIDAQRTGVAIAEGVIRDAIDAAHRGEQLDTSIADWSYYRSQLTAMLEPPPAEAMDDKSQAPDAIMDEENERPIVTGDSSQQSANDSFGEGASAKTDAALGDMSADSDTDLQRGKKPKPPAKVRAAALRAARSSSGGDAEDPILKLTRKNLDEAARRDSPGRLHQLMAPEESQADPNRFDW
ncbi:VWA domain-containing protein [Steroidobacter sp. S1-65]|uniref:VWA domain-containing protein n=1 Tax=Steroidobacter gossypii TaxID=2805490 RepID=A0ABS1WZZ9_9GAMM|nr:VWA domain-containing protein [Steroidobacter gossypii]MBM0106569.1 VWA domain-containing protein [Steroidobacter gossypii]